MTYSNVSSLQLSAAGIARAQYAPVGPDGIANSSLASGQDSPLSLYVAIKAAGGQIPEPRTVDVSGDNGRFLHRYLFNPAQLGQLDLNFGIFDMSAYSRFSGTKIDASNAEWNIAGMETNQNPRTNQILLLTNQDAMDAGSVNNGQQRFLNYIYPLVTVYFLGGNGQEANAQDWNYRGVLTRAGKMPWGTPFTALTNGFTAAARLLAATVYPMTLHTFVPASSTGTFNLTYTPSSDATGFGIKAWNTVTGLPITLTSVVPGTRAVSYSGAGAGVPHVVAYEAIDLLAA